MRKSWLWKYIITRWTHNALEEEYEEYANKNGLAEEIKTAIRIILEHNPTLFPKKVRLKLIMDKAKYKIEHSEIPPLNKYFIHFVLRVKLLLVLERAKVKP